MRSQEESGGARRSQEEPGGARRSQEEPGGARRSQEEPGGARRGKEDPGGPRELSRTQEAQDDPGVGPRGRVGEGRGALLRSGPCKVHHAPNRQHLAIPPSCSLAPAVDPKPQARSSTGSIGREPPLPRGRGFGIAYNSQANPAPSASMNWAMDLWDFGCTGLRTVRSSA